MDFKVLCESLLKDSRIWVAEKGSSDIVYKGEAKDAPELDRKVWYCYPEVAVLKAVPYLVIVLQ